MSRLHPRPRTRRNRLTMALVATTGLAVTAATMSWSPAAAGSASSATSAQSSSSAAKRMAPLNRRILDNRIRESSGLAQSTWKRPVLFTHNDSGDSARVFAVSTKGRTLAVLRLKGAKSYDWEDMAAGPNHTLWVGDTGDNRRSRKQIQVYRFKEPQKLRNRTVKSTKFTFAYPDGARDAEGLMVHPRNGRVFVISKQERGAVYVAPKHLSSKKVNKLRKLRNAPTKVTSANFRPNGKGYVLGTYSSAFVYKGLKSGARKISLPSRQQGESITFNRSGKRLLAGSEGSRSPIYQVASKVQSSRPRTYCVKAPAYRTSETKFGASLSTSGQTLAESVQDVDSKFGRVPVVRMFHPSLPSPGDWSRRAPVLGNDRTIVTSFKLAPKDVLSGAYDKRIKDYFREAPANPILYSYFHEPDAKVASGMFSPAEYRAAFRHIVNLAGSLCRTNLYPTLILTGWAADPASGRDWRDFYPGNAYVSVMSWDPYNSATAQPTEYLDPSTLYAHVLRESKVIGKPWGIAETGSARIPGDAKGTQRAAWLRKVGNYFDAKGAAYVSYFQSTNDQDFELRDQPSIKAWKDWVQS